MPIRKTTTLLVILALVAAACSSSGSDATDETYPNNYEPAASDDAASAGLDSYAGSPSTTDRADRPAAEPADAADEASFYNYDRDGYPDTEFEDPGTNRPEDTDADRFSTFALDVDTGSYTIARSYVLDGSIPDPEGIRVEEFVNFFQQDYPRARDGEEFTVSVDGGRTPFVDRFSRVIRVGIQAEEVEDRPSANLTFVIDTSGSMREGSRLEIVKDSLAILVTQLRRDDTVSIVEFGDRASVVLDPTSVADEREILRAIDSLSAGGSTNFEAGLRLGYDLVNEEYLRDGINRVIVASDGVANVGLENPDDLASLIQRDADRGVGLITIGVGLGNYNDVLLEQLADQGDGFYAYVDTRDEAERLFVNDLTGSLLTIAKDARVQVEFNPEAVMEYRLIGFENREISDRDFRNDSVDAGEIGSGHTVTALYAVELTDAALDRDMELGRVFLRWLDPDTLVADEIRTVFGTRDLDDRFEDTSVRFQQDVIVAQYAEILSGSRYSDLRTADELVPFVETLERFLPRDRDIEEFADLVRDAARLGA